MNYRRANNTLLGLIILVNAYVVLAPFSGLVINWWRLNHTDTKQQLSAKIERQVKAPLKSPINHVIIPDAGIDTDINTGAYKDRYTVLKKGAWIYDRGSTPDKGSNTVLIGHRFTYTNPRGVFYALDKVHVGSTIAVNWSQKQYIYTVSEIKTVDASDTAIQDASSESKLTIFTCTPLLHPTQRLAVTAILKEQL